MALLARFYAGEKFISHITNLWSTPPSTRPDLPAQAPEQAFVPWTKIDYNDAAQGELNTYWHEDHDAVMWWRDPAHGTPGNDIIHLNGGNDIFDDTFLGISPFPFKYSNFGGGNDWIYGGTGNDEISAGIGNDHVYGEFGDDKIAGGIGDDFLFGNDSADILGGGPGSDFLDGGFGNDILGGAAERSDLNVLYPPLPVVVTSVLEDDGNDTMQGGPGEDTIYGGKGADQLWGGPDADTFVFRLMPDNILRGDVDNIMDFEKSVIGLGDGDSVIVDKISFNYQGFAAEIGSSFTDTFKNTSELILEAGGHQSAIDAYIGFLYDEQTHDLLYKSGEDTLLLLHLTNDIDSLTMLSNVDNTFVFAYF